MRRIGNQPPAGSGAKRGLAGVHVLKADNAVADNEPEQDTAEQSDADSA